MSTVPGDDSTRDAGLVTPDEDVVNLVEETEVEDTATAGAGEPGRGTDEYVPRSARPDLDGTADEADVVEQASAVPGAEEDYA
ncbi:hypothetical protein IF650_12795 [Cellulosimicrobium terreum]|nr:hypothetical protein [Cellulosimicrobium terreum]